MQSIKRTRREVLSRAGLLVGGVLLQQPLIEIAQTLLAGGEPVELVDAGGERLEIGRLAQPGLSISEDRADQLVLDFGLAEIEQQPLVVVELIQPLALRQFAPSDTPSAAGPPCRSPPAS